MGVLLINPVNYLLITFSFGVLLITFTVVSAHKKYTVLVTAFLQPQTHESY
jgi:hypothetical protein